MSDRYLGIDGLSEAQREYETREPQDYGWDVCQDCGGEIDTPDESDYCVACLSGRAEGRREMREER